MVTNTTATAELVDTGETRDQLGRKITPRVRRAELVALWRQSGLTQAAFARREGVRYPHLCKLGAAGAASWPPARRARAEGVRLPRFDGHTLSPNKGLNHDQEERSRGNAPAA